MQQIESLTLRDYQSEIIRAVHSAMSSGFKRPLIVLPTGAGKTVCFAWFAQKAQEKGSTIWFLVHRKELYDQTVETFRRFGIPLDTIHIGMIGRKNADFPRPDLIVFDEAHHATAGTWRKMIERFPEAWYIGLTATPSRLDGKPLGQIFDTLIVGETTQTLITNEYLSDYDYFSISSTDLENLKKRGSDYDPQDAAGRLITVCGDVVANYPRGRQGICFCATVEHSKAQAKAYREGGINAQHFDGETPKKEREKLVADFKAGKIEILTNVNLISEGFDMPDCEVIVQLRPTQSLTIFLQQVGRALRPQDGKRAIIYDHVGNYTRHGLPDDNREWSLTERVKERKTQTATGAFLIRTCLRCYAVYKNTLEACPICGEPYQYTRTEIRIMRDIELEKIEKDRMLKEKSWAMSSGALEQAKSYSDLCMIAKHRGYKTGWAWYRAKSKGFWTPY